jgi:hypothetical protein
VRGSTRGRLAGASNRIEHLTGHTPLDRFHIRLCHLSGRRAGSGIHLHCDERFAKGHCPWLEWRGVFGLKDIKSATNVAEVSRAGKDVVEPNGHIRGLMFATPKQPREEQCPLL